MKKLVITFILFLGALSIWAVEVEINGLWFEVVTKIKEAKVIKSKDNIKYSGDIVIPESVQYDGITCIVTSIENEAFSVCLDMTSITIPNSVTNIGDRAFSYCRGLTSIEIPNSVKSIGVSVFEECKSLISVTIPNSVTSIGDNTFQYCSSLTHITIPNSMTSIVTNTFYGCSKLSSVIIPNSVTSIGRFAFYGCTSLASITIPNSVTKIEEYAFDGCNALTSVTIPYSVTNIGSYAFYGCSYIESVILGTGVEIIGEKAFANCPELTDVCCYAKSVPNMMKRNGKTPCNDAFDGSFIEYATLHVPGTAIDAYKTTAPWSDFGTIIGLDGTLPDVKKCATPTIAFKDGKLVFECETEGAAFVYSFKSASADNIEGNNVSLPNSYTVTVYAKKDGYENSDTVTQEVKLQGATTDVNGDGIVDTQDVLEIYKYIQEH